MPRHRDVACLIICSLTLFTPLHADEPSVSFRNEVMAVLSKAGCNQGTCHGNANGKGGFRLSLRGEDPEGDYRVLTHDARGRRVNPAAPEASLLLLKPTMQVAHVGGRRFEPGSDAYWIIRKWIADGLPEDSDSAPRLTSLEVTPSAAMSVSAESEVTIRVEARFSDGQIRDVTEMAVYEPAQPVVTITNDGRVTPKMPDRLTEVTIGVRFLDEQRPVAIAFLPERPEFRWRPPPPSDSHPPDERREPLSEIDRLVFEKLRRLQINPSAICDDSAFVRRAYLDLNGLIPTAEQARDFVDSDDPEKRRKLIDTLLERPEFADWWTLKWSDLLRNEQKVLDRKGVASFQAWIRSAIAGGLPMNEFAREILASRGSTYSNPAANYYRAMRDPIMRAESAAQVFLGVRLQCAKCHNHPFDRWTQDDYYGWASLFARVDYKILENNRRDRNDKHEFDGEQIVYQKPAGSVTDPRTGQPAQPQLLGGMMSVHADAGHLPDSTPGSSTAMQSLPFAAASVDEDPLRALADWVAHPQNRQFARLQVNRIWAELLGRGLVEPVDDFRVTNPPSHPQLLEWLTDDFIAHGYDLRHMIRTICNSQIYQLAATPTPTNHDDERNCSRAIVRRLTAEQLLDSLSRALEVPLEFNDYPTGLRAAQLPGAYDVYPRHGTPSVASQFLTLFGKPPRLQACSCERSPETTLAQSFQLLSGPLLHEILRQEGNRLDRLLEADRPPSRVVEELYWSTLSRPPTADERMAMERQLAASGDPRQTLEDLAWALVTSGEFLFHR